MFARVFVLLDGANTLGEIMQPDLRQCRNAIVAGVAGGVVVALIPRLSNALDNVMEQYERERQEAIAEAVARRLSCPAGKSCARDA